MRITHSDPTCGCAFCVVGRAADAGESVTLTVDQARELSHDAAQMDAAQMLLLAQRNAEAARRAMERVSALEDQAAPPPREAVH